MTWPQRFLVKLAARFTPEFGRALSAVDGSMERLSEKLTMYRAMERERKDVGMQMQAELQEACSLAGPGYWGSAPAELAESSRPVKELAKIKEAFGTIELEMALEDRGWKRMIAASQFEFSRYGITQLILITRLYFLKNPLVRRGIQVSAHYVFGRGIDISSDDPKQDEVLNAFFKDPRNAHELSHTALVEKEEARHTDGNIFWVFFRDPVDGQLLVRTIDPIEIEEIISDPNDSSVPWLYRRRWFETTFNPVNGIKQQNPRVAWYVDANYDSLAGFPDVGQQIGGVEVMRGPAGEPIPVMHQKSGGLAKWQFGCPMAYSALDWARAYRNFLEDWAIITRGLARFAWTVETEGGAPAIANFKNILATTLGSGDGSGIETNPAPVAGAHWISGPTDKITPMKTAGATTNPEQGRRVMLMVAAAFGLPETFFGDASTGSLATAQSLDRPTELKFLQAQEHWREVLKRMGAYALKSSGQAPKGRLKEAAANGQLEIDVKVSFPSVLEHDIAARVNAIVEGMTLNGFEVSGIDERVGVFMILQELGVEDAQEVIEAMYPEDAYEPDRTIEEEPAAVPAPGQQLPPGTPAPPQPPDPAQQPGNAKAHPHRTKAHEARTARAVASLLKAAKKLRESQNGHAH